MILLNDIVHKFKYGKHILKLETGMIARQATSSVMASMDDTSVFVTIVCSSQIKQGQSFFPLTVNYQERTYAAGRFPGGFFRREGRPSENEILISRLIDRPIRPLFPKDFFNEVQIIATVMSLNPQVNPDIVAIIGVSAAIGLSGLPFKKIIGAARVGYIKGKYILNPNQNELHKSNLDLIVSSTENEILMVESESKELNELEILNGIIFGHNKQKELIKNINKLILQVNKKKIEYEVKKINKKLKNEIYKISKTRLEKLYNIVDKTKRNLKINIIKNEIISNLILIYPNSEEEIKDIFYNLEKKIVRNKILFDNIRIDGRSKDMIRDINIKIGILSRTHGSALFTRGETQALVTVTLGTERDAQNIDELIGERIDRFLLHYNFPPYCVGDIGIISSPKRREIGHGRLVKRGLLSVMPNIVNFPYTIRVVSEITESNGSSSMASVCGASLALMDAGVPIKSSVAGIAMGLIKNNDSYIILSDILGDEDYLGDMDFKVIGTRNGITALQMDIKIEGINNEIIYIALKKAKKAIINIIDIMESNIITNRKEISKFAPRIHSIKISPNKIKDIIGKGGAVIRALTEETGTSIEIEDDGTIKIASNNNKKIKFAIKRIKEITSVIEVGKFYQGKVIRIVSFGAFLEIANGKEGLVHISQIVNKRIDKVDDYLGLGQKILVKVLEIDRNGRIKLSIKEANLYNQNGNFVAIK